jgi:alpha-galactosidase
MPVKITIVGGGSSMFVPLLLRRFLAAPCLRGGTVVLMDVDATRLEVMASLARALVASEGAELAIESTLDQREALTGADFVIVAIAVGGMPAWESDIEIPGRHGVYMHIADSIGPGGMLRAFRNLPVIDSICRDLAAVSPGAWVFNYTNPASAVAAVLRDARDVRSASLCSCTGAPSDPAWLAELAGVEPAEIFVPVPVGGLNHCAGITQLRLRDGRDAIPLVRARVTEPVVQWVIDTFGMVPYCWAHWVEFFPQLQRLEEPYEGRAQGLAMRYGRRIYVMDNERKRAQTWQDVAERWSKPEHAAEVSLANLPSGPEDAGIEVVDVIQSLLENRGERYIVNVRNGGAIPNLPDDAIVEVQAVVDGYGIRPVASPPLPDSLAAHLSLHAAAQELTVRAALSGDRQLALEAFLLDPLLAATLEVSSTERLLDEMLEANAGFLPRFA